MGCHCAQLGRLEPGSGGLRALRAGVPARPTRLRAQHTDQAMRAPFFCQATGFAVPLARNAAGFWQSRNQYHNQTEILQLARNFSEKRIPVSVIAIDLGLPAAPPHVSIS